MVEIDGQGVLKRSEDKSKAINPGFQITYRITRDGLFRGDVTCLRGDNTATSLENRKKVTIRDEYDNAKITTFEENSYEFKPLQKLVMKNGEIIAESKSALEKRNYYLSNLHGLNDTQKRLINPHYYKADISDELFDLKNRLIDSLINEINKFDGK